MTDNNKEKFFSKDKRDKVIKWLNLKSPNLTCECCKQKAWTLAEDMIMPMPFTGGGLTIGGPSYPQVMIICNTCGNTKYFNAVMIGIVEGAGEKDAK